MVESVVVVIVIWGCYKEAFDSQDTTASTLSDGNGILVFTQGVVYIPYVHQILLGIESRARNLGRECVDDRKAFRLQGRI